MEALAPHLSDSRTLTLQLHSVLADCDPARFQVEASEALYERLQATLDELKQLVSSTWTESGTVQRQMAELCLAVEQNMPSLESVDASAVWIEFRNALQPAYEATVASLAASSVDVPSLRPTNYVRNFFHVFNAASVILLAEFLPLHWIAIVAGLGSIGAWSMELGRRNIPVVNSFLMTLFHPVAHPHEAHRINSATWYTTAVTILALCFPVQIGVAALAILGLGDPLAAIIGRRFGRHRLVNGRSLEGTAAFVLFGGAAAFFVLTGFHPEIGLGAVALLSVVGGLAGGVAELYSKQIDDNLSVPMAAAVAMALVMPFF